MGSVCLRLPFLGPALLGWRWLRQCDRGIRSPSAVRHCGRRRLRAALFVGLVALFTSLLAHAGEPANSVDATTLKGKVLCGYQGWFRCPGDGTENGWLHWSRDRNRISPATVTFEMWPDMTEYGPEERYPATGLAYPDGQPAELFSSANAATVDRHFRWMEEYGIDGVFVQRFLVNLPNPSFDVVLSHMRASAKKSGRTYAICYDLSGARSSRMVDQLLSDWKRLVDEEKLLEDERYLRHEGKPVLFVWGFFSDRFEADVAHRLIDSLKTEDRYGVTLIGGCQWPWRTERDPEWARAFRRLDVISPWNIGNVRVENGMKFAATDGWQADREEAESHGAEFLPVVYPGFGWTNLKGERSNRDTIPRRKGEFFREQFAAAKESGATMAYVAMFDEVDEATAIFEVTDSPPSEPRFQTLEGLPSDFYLRLTGEGTKMIRGERTVDQAPPIER